MSAFKWDDPILLDSQLSDAEKMVRDAAREKQGPKVPRIARIPSASEPLPSQEDRFVNDVPNVTVWLPAVCASASMAIGDRSSRMRGAEPRRPGTENKRGRRVFLPGPPSVLP